MQQSRKILIVEDEGLIAKDIANRLEALGHEVIATVGTAAEALDLAAGADIVLMDIRIDGPVDGIEAANRVRARFHVPVVFLTAHVDRGTLERAKDTDPFGYIVKPVATATLQTTLVIAIYKHQMQRQLEEREAWLRAVQHATADAVVTTDPQGTIRTLNPAAERLFKGKAKTIGELIPGDPAAVAILKDGPAAISTCFEGQHLEGFATPVKSGPTAVGTVITLRDVSAQQREQRRIRQAEKAEAAAELAGRVAGDYGNLVAIIRAQAEQLVRQFGDYSPARQALEEIQQAAAAADQITRRLAGVGTDDPGHPEVVGLHSTLRRMASLIQSVVGEGVTVTIRPNARTGKIHADPTQVEDILMRLVLHAGNSLIEGGHLVIETADAHEDILLSLSHDGPRTQSAAADLSLARYLAAEDGRRMEAVFPRWVEPDAAAGAPPTLLLIEPREHIRERLHNFFEANGYNLLEADDEEQARLLLELRAVDLVIRDGSPAAIDADANAASVPVLMVTAPYSQQSLLEQVRSVVPPDHRDSLIFSAASP